MKLSAADFNFPKPLWWSSILILGAVIWGGSLIWFGKSAINPGELLISGLLLILIFQMHTLNKK